MINIKNASLLAGVLQQTALVLIIRYSKTLHQDQTLQDHPSYLTSIAVASAEVLKLLLSAILEVVYHRGIDESIDSPSNTVAKKNIKKWETIGSDSLNVIKRLLSLCNRQSFRLMIPAALYLIQNNLLFVALSNLSVPTYQVTNQGKLLTTAIISRIMLKKHLNGMQYFSITLLGLGVAVIQLSEFYQNMNHVQHENVHASGDHENIGSTQNQRLGFMAVLISCFTSGFASVYFELILKIDNKQKHSLHHKNFQLASFSLLFAVIQIACKDLPQIKKHGLFHGFDGVVIMVVVAQAMTGFVVSLMLHYADAILKGFAISVAAVLATVVSMLIFGTKINRMFFIGASMVGIAIKLYSYYGEKNSVGNSTLLSHSGERRAKCNLRMLCVVLLLSLGALLPMRYTYSLNFAQDLVPEYPHSLLKESGKGTQDMNATNTMRPVTSIKTSHEDTSATSLSATATTTVEPQKCHIRNLSNYTRAKVGELHKTSLKTHLKDANCIFFNCSRVDEYCNNGMLPTNYNGPSPPCCVHILRDVSRIFDEEMCRLGLEYSAAFGTLLGLHRSDRIIPWTIDTDYIIPSEVVANAMVALWDVKETGLAHIYQSINRMCITPDFAGGKLQREWSIPNPKHNTSSVDTLWAMGFPYIDFYVGRNITKGGNTLFGEIANCRHNYHDIFPTKRIFVYNSTFAQRLPANPDQLLRSYYGKEWRTPQPNKNPHGGAICPYGPNY